MESQEDVTILKFGGASVSTPASFSHVADIILKRKIQHRPIVVVVSAMGDTTDSLIAMAQQVNPQPPRRELDMLVSVGERISIALLAMALHAKGVPACSFTGSQVGIITSEDHFDAKIIDVRPKRIWSALKAGQVVVVAGYQGMSLGGEITTLGRGGSDTTAVALGCALRAKQVEFFKDVAGIFDCDPKKNPNAQLIPELDYERAYQMMAAGAEVLHPRAVRLAERNNLPLRVCSFEASFAQQEAEGTWVRGDASSSSAAVLFEEEG